MKNPNLFSKLFRSTLEASGTHDANDLYFECMFSSFCATNKVQISPSCTSRIVNGDQLPPRELMQYYWDPDSPRCPRKLQEDLTALVYCCYFDAPRSRALRQTLAHFLTEIPEADAEDLRQIISLDDLPRAWAILVWYALCVDAQKTDTTPIKIPCREIPAGGAIPLRHRMPGLDTLFA